jgi:hypothetical protein
MRITGRAFTPREAWALLVFAAVWLFYFVEAAIWRWWDRSEADRLFAREPYEALSPPLCIFGFALLAGAELGLMLMVTPAVMVGVAAGCAIIGGLVLALPDLGLDFHLSFRAAKKAARWALFYWLVLFLFTSWILFYWIVLFPSAPTLTPLRIATVTWGVLICIGLNVLKQKSKHWRKLRKSLNSAWRRWSRCGS